MEYDKIDVRNCFSLTEFYTAHQHKYNSNFPFRGESHDFWELVIVSEGDVSVVAGNSVIKVPGGYAFLHEPMEFHRILHESHTSHISIITFNCNNMPSLKSRLFKTDETIIKKAHQIIQNIHTCFETKDDCIVAVKKNQKTNSQMIIKEIELLVLNLINDYTSEIEQSELPTAKHYITIINVLENNVEKNLTVKDIAGLCDMSEVNLKKTFSKYTGIGIKTYFNRLKVNKAKIMLKNGTSVSDTAYALGFTDQNYFSTMFKRITGNPPTFYKSS